MSRKPVLFLRELRLLSSDPPTQRVRARARVSAETTKPVSSCDSPTQIQPPYEHGKLLEEITPDLHLLCKYLDLFWGEDEEEFYEVIEDV